MNEAARVCQCPGCGRRDVVAAQGPQAASRENASIDSMLYITSRLR